MKLLFAVLAFSLAVSAVAVLEWDHCPGRDRGQSPFSIQDVQLTPSPMLAGNQFEAVLTTEVSDAFEGGYGRLQLMKWDQKVFDQTYSLCDLFELEDGKSACPLKPGTYRFIIREKVLDGVQPGFYSGKFEIGGEKGLLDCVNFIVSIGEEGEGEGDEEGQGQGQGQGQGEEEILETPEEQQQPAAEKPKTAYQRDKPKREIRARKVRRTRVRRRGRRIRPRRSKQGPR